MHDRAEVAPHLHAWDHGLTVDQALAREFEARLIESSTLAVRVAYSVLRHRQDAEDVAQEAFAKAYRSFRHLRDRDRFRAWLVRMTWRLALDRRRSDRRRQSREDREVAGSTGLTRHLEEDVIATERSARLWQAIDQLPEKLRVVVVQEVARDRVRSTDATRFVAERVQERFGQRAARVR